MPFRTESSFASKAYSDRKPFPFHVCTMDADGSGNKRPTGKGYTKKNSIQSRFEIINLPYMLFHIFFWEGYF